MRDQECEVLKATANIPPVSKSTSLSHGGNLIHAYEGGTPMTDIQEGHQSGTWLQSELIRSSVAMEGTWS